LSAHLKWSEFVADVIVCLCRYVTLV